MKRIAGFVTGLVLAFAAAYWFGDGAVFQARAQDGDPPAPEAPAEPEAQPSVQEQTGYAFGFNLGRKLKEDLDLVDLEALVAGLRDGAGGKEPKMKEEEIKAALEAFNVTTNKRVADRAKKKGEDFLAENKKKDGVKETASGLQYKVITEGTGRQPLVTSVVSVHYEGTLIDGTVFDSSYKRGQPAQFPLNRVIPGWTEGLQLMKEGSKYQLFIPSSLAYGARGAGDVIPPHSTLIFTVELLKVN